MLQVSTDRLFAAKKEIMDALGYGEEVQFPVYQERMPLQLLGYWRLARMQNSAELAMVSPCAAPHESCSNLKAVITHTWIRDESHKLGE